MNAIRPIETEYQGCRFRSRLEARWAVFFDTLAWPWSYEPEGFELSAGRYLPDFWLSGLKCWVEIKPENEWAYHARCDELARTSGSAALYVCGEPWLGRYAIALYEPELCYGTTPFVFGLGPRDDREVWLCGPEYHICLRATDSGDRQPQPNALPLRRAYESARSARFERYPRNQRRILENRGLL
jgi:hypothetical protein